MTPLHGGTTNGLKSMTDPHCCIVQSCHMIISLMLLNTSIAAIARHWSCCLGNMGNGKLSVCASLPSDDAPCRFPGRLILTY